MAQTRLILFVCDHATCNNSVEGRNQNTPGMTVPVSGYSGTVKITKEAFGGDRSARWFACRRTHVNGAVKNAMEKLGE